MFTLLLGQCAKQQPIFIECIYCNNSTNAIQNNSENNSLLQSDVTELNWHGLVFDELTNGQAVMHYSRHRLTTSVA